MTNIPYNSYVLEFDEPIPAGWQPFVIVIALREQPFNTGREGGGGVT